MQKLKAIFTLIRFPNLVFIYLTQVLTYITFFTEFGFKSYMNFEANFTIWLPLGTVLIAAAGYIINDYFDIKIDQINKPEKVIIEKYISRKSAIIWHVILNILALGLFILIKQFHFKLFIIQLAVILSLVFYSSSFKRKLLIGNIVVSIFTALCIYLVGVLYFRDSRWDTTYEFYVYILFAFLITFYREIIKDIEDVKGDGNENCNTLPIVVGISKAKIFAYCLCSIIILLLLGLLYFSFLVMLFSFKFWTISLFLLIFLIIILLSISIFKLKYAYTSSQLHSVSSLIKIITFIGILSMIFIL
jgi:4-hydroxybenzoate polyprenyltransferase